VPRRVGRGWEKEKKKAGRGPRAQIEARHANSSNNKTVSGLLATRDGEGSGSGNTIHQRGE
jgi:hypothetical protein